MAGSPEDREFLDSLWSFLKQSRHKAFPSPQLLEDFRRKFVVDGIVSLKKSLENLAEDNAALTKQLREMQVQKSCQQFPMTQCIQPPEFRRLLNKHVEENARLNEKVMDLCKENSVLRKEFQDLKTQLEKNEEIARLCGEIGSVNMRNDHLGKKMEDYEFHLNELMTKLEERERIEIAVLNHKLNILNEQLEMIQKTNVHMMQAAEIQTLIADVQTEIGMLREEFRNLKSTGETDVGDRDRRQTQQLDGYEKEIEVLETELKERSLQRAALIGQEKILKEKVQRIEETNEELTIQTGDLQAQLLAKEREVCELKEEENRMRNVEDKNIEERDDLIKKLNEYKKQITEMKIKLEERSVERAAIIGQINVLNKKVQLKEKANHEFGVQIAGLQTQIMDKEREVYELRKESNRVERNAEKEIKNLKDRVEELMKDNESQRKQYERGCARDMNHLRDQIIELKLDNEVINNMKIDKTKENTNLLRIIAEKNDEIRRQNRKIVDLRSEVRAIKNDGHKRTIKKVESQSDGLHDQKETPQLDKNLQDEFTLEKPEKEELNSLKSEAEEETKLSEALQDW